MTSSALQTSLNRVHSFTVGPHAGWILHDGNFLMPATAVARGASQAELTSLLGDALQHDGQLELSVNVMLLRWGHELILIDAGCGLAYGPALGQLERSLQTVGFTPADITAVLFTHLHLDHIAGSIDTVARSVRFPSARFFAHREEVAFWRESQPDLSGSAVPPEQRTAIINGIRDGLEIFGNKLELFSSEETFFEGVTALSLPGHTPFHTGFLLEGAGDAVLNMGDAMIDPRLHVPHPEWPSIGDAQPAVTGETRCSVCQRAGHEQWRLFGCHFPFPGLGRIRFDNSENGKKGVRWIADLV
jgi:glyoxylase-like metal-dependent hydrolase (beta-lactamase superfamily II)